MELEQIRQQRNRLEDDIERLVRRFEADTGAIVRRITFGQTDVQIVGEPPRQHAVQAREQYNCFIELAL